MLWKEGLMIKLHDDGMQGCMLTWIWALLQNWSIQIRVRGAFSERIHCAHSRPVDMSGQAAVRRGGSVNSRDLCNYMGIGVGGGGETAASTAECVRKDADLFD